MGGKKQAYGVKLRQDHSGRVVTPARESISTTSGAAQLQLAQQA